MLKKGIIVAVILVLLYALGGFFVLPAYLRPVLEEKLSRALNRTVAIRELRINPFMLSMDVKGFSVREKGSGAPFLSFDELSLNAQARSLIKGGPVVREVTLTGPRIAVTRFEGGRYNFSDLLEKKPDKKPKKRMSFSVGNIVVARGSVLFTDNVAHTTHKAEEINFSIPFLSNLDEFVDVYTQPRFSARINGTPFTLAGETKPFKHSLETTLDLDLAGISLPYYMGYLPPGLRVGVTSGTLDVKTHLSYVQHKGRKPIFTLQGTLALHKFSLDDKGGTPLLTLAEARLALAPSPLTERLVHITLAELVSPSLTVTRDRSGKVNLASLSSPGKKEPGTEKDKPGPFVVNLDRVALTGGAVDFTDLSKESPVKILADEISFDAKGLSTKPDAKGTFDLSSRVNGRCRVTSAASLSLKPLNCDARLDVEGFEPAWVQPYFTDRFRVSITRGSISTKGTLLVEKKGADKAKVAFAGDASLVDLATIDKASSEDFTRCRDLSLGKMKFGLNPDYLDIGRVRISGFFSQILVNKKGSVNVAAVVKEGKAKKPAPPEPGNKKRVFEKITIREVVVDNARVAFKDRSVKEGYAAELSRLRGTVRGISLNRAARANVTLTGRLNNSAPVLITGTINPFRENFFLNLHTSITNLDLSPMSPYSGTYVGYDIEKGKLSLDLTYRINHKELDSQNNIFIDQFTFGRPVESPKATKLPVRFAVALLKDSKGQIDLKLPVKGRTDDPTFSVWGIVLTMLKNLVVKAATSPFLLLDALYPGASQSNTLEFAYGRSDLPDGSAPKLATVTKILGDKPSLSLEVRGYADPEQDRLGLVDALFEKKLKAQKLKVLLRKGQKVSLGDVTLTPEEYPAYLKKAYAAEDFPKPKNLIGLPQGLPPAEMEKLMKEHIEVTGSDLRLLAMERAQKVQEYLAESQKVASSRIFLIETGDSAPEPRQGVKGSRVELMLK